MTELGWLLLAFLSTIVATNIALVVVVRRFFKRMRRNLALNAASLRVRAQLSRGPRREVLRLRLRLTEALDSGQTAVDLAIHNDGPRGELPLLFRRLKSEGAILETQLRLLESEYDATVLADVLPAVRHRVDEVTHVVRRLRSAVLSGLGNTSDDSLAALRVEVDREITAVRAGMQELQNLNGRGTLFESGHQPSTDHFTKN